MDGGCREEWSVAMGGTGADTGVEVGTEAGEDCGSTTEGAVGDGSATDHVIRPASTTEDAAPRRCCHQTTPEPTNTRAIATRAGIPRWTRPAGNIRGAGEPTTEAT